MNVQEQQQQQQPLSFDGISKYFSLPLSDAASKLGVCVSVLKKICRDNGLDRWPYRKFLAGKSVEEIKKDAAREKAKERAALSKVLRPSGSQYQNNEVSKLHGSLAPPKLLQPGSKELQIGRSQITKGMSTIDEFKYGFPSDGLSTITCKWWGNGFPEPGECIDDGEAESGEQTKSQSEDKTETRSTKIEEDKPQNGDIEANICVQGSGLLKAVRKQSVEEGRSLLRLGFYKKYPISELSKKQRLTLLRIFDTSLPGEWINGSS